MMKIISLVVFIAVIVERTNAGPEEMAKLVADCKIAEKVSDADVMNFKNKVKPLPKESKCLVTCLAEKMGMINTNGTLNKEGMIKLAKAIPNSNEQMVKSATEIADIDCKDIKDADRCEFGAKAMECIIEAGGKRQLPNICAM